MRRLAFVASIILIIVALGRDVLVPFTLAILFSFLLAPVVDRLERLRVPRAAAVLAVVTCAFLVIGFVGWIVTRQVLDLVREDRLPQYEANIRRKIHSLRRSSVGGTVKKMAKDIQKIGRELAKEGEETTGTAATAPPAPPAPPEPGQPEPEIEEKPVPVKVVEPSATPLDFTWSALQPLGALLGTAAVVVLLVVFMLLKREDLRDRVIRLVGEGHIFVTTQAMDEAARRVSRYLLMQLIVNITYGVPVGIGLWLIGVPNAMLWGVLATLLRYLPYVGPVIAASLPVAFSVVAFDSWVPTLYTIALFIILEVLSNNVVEPLLYSSSTGVSVVALVASAAFWTWLWGAIGLVLATPITVCLAVIGRNVPQLQFLHILLGDEPVLEPKVRFYQRLLALDVEEAREMAEEALETVPLAAACDALLLPALSMAEQDRHRGLLTQEQHRALLDNVRGMVEDLDEYRQMSARTAEPPTADVAADSAPPAAAPAASKARVLCVPARGEADAIVNAMLCRLLGGRDPRIVSASQKTLTGELLDQIARERIDIVLVSAMPPFADKHARYVCKRLRARHPSVKAIVGLWLEAGDPKRALERIGADHVDRVVVSLTQAVEQIPALGLSATLHTACPLPAREETSDQE